MIPMERRFKNKNRVTKTGDFSQEAIQKLKNSKDMNGKDKRSYKKAV